ncbi:hypothetical protein Clim_1039 [Chlorobium limicola DSM 245]|uniref:Uncharacterized protein n=1 Tax=Chlorobium limicola (strain DSM 245 / NBRC 103803 / 6330) TaxID=290315 RepID=B3EC39_CHLL2|nr:hypothetical protein Clim_1039 [Chlorobium limicola DSM 245]
MESWQFQELRDWTVKVELLLVMVQVIDRNFIVVIFDALQEGSQ